MSPKSTVDILFKEHSFEEIESVRDNLASEIDKRTELLKSIVKEKYRDVVETSDAIQSMKLNLSKLQLSISRLDSSINVFYQQIAETNSHDRRTVRPLASARGDASAVTVKTKQGANIDEFSGNGMVRQLLSMSTEIWDHFDRGDLRMSIKLYNDSRRMLDKIRGDKYTQQEMGVLRNLEAKLKKDEQMIKNFLWHKIQSAETNQVGVIAGSDEVELYSLSLRSSMEFLVERFRKQISDVSYQAQIQRYQQYSYFNTTTNTIDASINDLKPPTSDYVQIPKDVSIELSAFLFDTCRVINTIAGFSLTRTSILDSLKTTVLHIISVYTDLITIIDKLNGGSKRRRSLQLYFDLMYIRVLLNTSKDLEFIEELDPKISKLMSQYEQMLDTIELYIVSEGLHSNVLQLSTSTIRLYGLLVPYLQ